MKKFWSSMIADIEPYIPGEQPKDRQFIKLNTNENPYPPSPHVIDAIRNSTGDSLRLYPDPSASELVSAIADYYGVKTDNVFVGNGSDEVLAMAFMAFFTPGKEIIFPDVSYSFYPVYASLFGLKSRTVPLNPDYSINVNKMAADGGVVLPNPNAPTGMSLPMSLLDAERIIQNNPNCVVILDEAYVDFGADTAIPLTNKYENLLVVQTMSKSRSLAGMRIGFAVGNSDLIAGLNAVKNSFNSYTLDRLAIAAGTAAMNDKEYFNICTQKVIHTREYTINELNKRGFTVLPSLANFIFVTHPNYNAERIFNKLREKGILVRWFKGGRTNDFLRISIGTDEEMATLVKTLDKITGGL